MITLGLTGGIGMGKSTVAKTFAAQGVPVCDADAIVHQLLGKNGAAVEPIRALFPEVVEDGAVNRKRLGAIVFADVAQRKALEAVIHPQVRAAEIAFIEQHQQAQTPLIVLEIPLLYEAGAESRCDKVVVVSCDPATQRQRVMARDGMSEARFKQILAAQMPDEQKRQRADFIVDTACDLEQVRDQIRQIMETLHA
ncbi:MAG: dephospho-CoA kinase [Rickettsiales bacterium]|nr:dephospho-CoA kinase [Rickettsiales bacterium]